MLPAMFVDIYVRKSNAVNMSLRKIVLCLMALTKDTPEEHSECGSSEEWTLALDRGGLWYVKETTFILFIAIEEVRECLKMLLGSNPAAGKKRRLLKKLSPVMMLNFIG